MQELLIDRSNLPYILSLLVTLFSLVLSQVFIVEPLVGEVSVAFAHGDMATFSSLRMESSLSYLNIKQSFSSLTTLLVYSLPYFISALELWVPELDAFGNGPAAGLQMQSSFSPAAWGPAVQLQPVLLSLALWFSVSKFFWSCCILSIEALLFSNQSVN